MAGVVYYFDKGTVKRLTLRVVTLLNVYRSKVSRESVMPGFIITTECTEDAGDDL